MQKIEFGDINRFFVSIGLFLIGFAMIIPYFYLKEDFGLYINQDDLAKFDIKIIDIFQTKSYQVALIQKIIPWLSIFFIISGIAISGIGIKRWLKRQIKLDEKLFNEVEKLKLEVKASTPKERIFNAKKETAESEIAEQLESGVDTIENPKTNGYLNYMEIEDKIFSYFKAQKSPNFDILHQPKIGNRFFVDILLKAKTNKFSDRIIEIKYFQNQLPLSIIQDYITKLTTYISYYKQNMGKRVIPILLIVYKSDSLGKVRVAEYKRRIMKNSEGFPELERLKVELILESEMDKFDVKKLLKK